MRRGALAGVVGVLAAAGVVLAGGRGINIVTGKFQSYKDGVLKVEDLRGGADVEGGRSLAVYRGHIDAVLAVAVVDGGRRLASGGGDGVLRLWDLPARPR